MNTKTKTKKTEPSPKIDLPTSSLKVEHGVPIPGFCGGPGAYPFDQMSKGDSFVVPKNGISKDAAKARVRGAFQRWDKRKIHQIAMLGVRGGIRTWLVK